MPSDDHSDDLFDCLANARRRTALACLDANETPVSARELARFVAVCETDAPEGGVPTDRAQRVYLSLRHAHLPKLAAAGIVDYDEDDSRVAEGPRFAAALDPLDRED